MLHTNQCELITKAYLNFNNYNTELNAYRQHQGISKFWLFMGKKIKFFNIEP